MVTNSIAQNQVEGARNDVLRGEAVRQNSLDREINTVNTESQDRYVGFEGQQDQRANDLAGMFASSVDDPNVSAVLPTSSSSIVNQETGQQKAKAQGYVDQQSGALADMRSFGDLLGQTSMLQARDAAKVGQLGGFKQGSQAVVPYELDDANGAGDGIKMFGDILRMGGTVATGAGIAGGGKSLASLFGKGSIGLGDTPFMPGINGPSLGLPTNVWYGV